MLRRHIFSGLLLLSMSALLLFSREATQAALDALALCAHTIIPSLFPFFVVSELFVALGCARSAGALFAPLLGISPEDFGIFLLGIIGGYPSGARAIATLYQSGGCSKRNAEALLTFCNNAGPAFILGIVGNGCFHDSHCGLWLYLIHVLSAILCGLLLRRHRPTDFAAPAPAQSLPFPTAFVRSVTGSALSMVRICGFVVFFQVLLRLMCLLFGMVDPLLIGLIELTSGVLALSDSSAGFICCAFLLGWGGLSVHCQTFAVLSDTDLSLRRYLAAKLLHALLSAIIAVPISIWI